MIVDSHVHLFGDEVRRRPADFFVRDRYFGERIRAGRTAEHAKLVASEPILAIKHINHIAE